MQQDIRIAIFEPGATAAFALIQNDLKHMQQMVGGYIEMLEITEDGLFLVCNEEGKIDGLPANRVVSGSGGSDVIVGTFFVARCDEEGDMTSILPQDEPALRAWTPGSTWNIETAGCVT